MRRSVLAALIAPVVLLAGMAAPASAATESRRITVTGTGTVTVERDRATTQFGISVTSKAARTAQTQLRSTVTKVRSAVLAAGAKTTDLTTTSLSLSPEYDYQANTRPVVIGYRASLTFSVRSAVDAVSTYIDAALEAGDDAVTINGIFFDSTKGAAAASSSRSRAVADARAKASEYAKAAGESVGKVLSIVEVGSPSIAPLFAKAAADSALPIDSGSQDVVATITVTFELK